MTFPFFSTVVAIIAALGDLAGAYALPALFVLVRPCVSLLDHCARQSTLPIYLAPWRSR